METAINYCEPGWAFISSDERRWINKIRKLAEEKPDECIIISQPENNDGFIYAKFPPKWARITPPKEVHLSEAERARRGEMLRQSRISRTTEQESEDYDE